MNVKAARNLRRARSFALEAGHQSNADLVKTMDRIDRATVVVREVYPTAPHRVRAVVNSDLKQGLLYRAAYRLQETVRR